MTARGWGGLLLSVALVSCGGGNARPNRGAGPIAVRVALPVPSSLPNLPIVMAQELGYYRQEGLSVTLNDLRGGAKALEALLGGSTDAASAMFEEVVHAAVRGRDLQAFVTTGLSPALALAVSPAAHRRFSRIEDLKGAVVGVTSPGSPTHMLLNYLLAKHGLARDSISVAGLGPYAARLAALERGTVDAAMLSEPAFTLLLRRHPDARVLARMYTSGDLRETFGREAYTGVVLFSTPGWLREHAFEARALARALQRSLAWLHSHSPEQIQAQAPRALQVEDAGVSTESIRRMLPTWSHDGVISREGVEAAWNVLSVADPEVRDAKVDLSRIYTNQFVAAK